MIDDLSIAEDSKSDSSQEVCAMIRILPTPRVANVRSISAMPVSLPERSELVCRWGRANDGRLICTWRQPAPDCLLGLCHGNGRGVKEAWG